MANNFEIRIKGALDERSTVSNIKKQLSDIEKQVQIDFKFDDTAVKNTTESVKQATTQTSSFNKTVSNANETVVKFGNTALDSAKKFLQWKLIGDIIVGLQNQITNMVSAVFELDSALIEFNKVASLSSDELDRFTESSFNVANEFGRSVDVAVQGSAAFKRAGFDIAESSTLASESLLLMNVGSLALEESVTSLISVMKSYGIEAEQSREITDRLNEVANTTEISVTDLANGLRRTGALFAQTGTELDELIGLIVGANQEIQNIEKVSSGLVTIASRLQRMNDETDELSQLVPQLEDEFNQLGLTLIDQDGQLKSVFDILNDLSTVYEDLDKNTQAHLNFLISGTRQSVVLASAMNDWDSVLNAVNSSLNSQGSAIKENLIFMDSLEGRTNVLSSQFTKLATDVIDKDLIKALISLATTGLSFIDVLAELGVLIPGIITAFVLLNTTTNAFATSLISKGVAAVNTFAVSMTGSMAVAIRSTTALVTGLTGAITFGLAVAIPAVIKLVDELTHAYENNIKEINDSIQQSENQVELYQEQIDTLKSLSDEYKSLSQQNFLTNEEQERLIEIQNQLLKQYPDLNLQIDSQGRLRGLNAQAIEAENERLKEQQRILQEGIISSELEKISATLEEFERSQAISNLVAQLTGVGAQIDADFGATLVPDIENTLQKIIELEVGFNDLGEFASSAGTLLKDDFIDRFVELNGEIDDTNLEQLRQEFGVFLETLSDPSLSNAINEYESLFETIKSDGVVSTQEIEQLNKAFVDVNQVLSDATDGLIGVENSIVRLPSDIGKLSSSVQFVATDFEALNETIDAYTDKSSLLGKTIEQLNDGQSLTLSQIKELSETFGDELNPILSANNDLNFNSVELYEKLFGLIQQNEEAVINSEIAKQQAFIDTAEAALLSVKSMLGLAFTPEAAQEEFGIDVQGLTEAQRTVALLEAELGALGQETTETYQKQTSERETQVKVLEDYFNILSKIEETEDQITVESKNRSALNRESADFAEQARASVEAEQDLIAEQVSNMRELNAERQKDLDLLLESGKADVETQEAIRELNDDIRNTRIDIIDLEQQSVDIESDLTSELEKQSEEIKKQNDQRKEEIDELFEKRVEAIDDEYDAIVKLIEDIGEAREQQLEDEIDRREAALDAIKEERTEEEEKLKILDAQAELQERQNDLIKARQVLENVEAERTARVFTGDGFEFVADPQAVRAAEEDVLEAEQAVVDAREDLRRTEDEIEHDRLVREKEAEIEALEERKQAIAEKTQFKIDAVRAEQEATKRALELEKDDIVEFNEILAELTEEEILLYEDKLTAVAKYATSTISYYNQIEEAALAANLAMGGVGSTPSVSTSSGAGTSTTTNNNDSSTNVNIGNLNLPVSTPTTATGIVTSLVNIANGLTGSV